MRALWFSEGRRTAQPFFATTLAITLLACGSAAERPADEEDAASPQIDSAPHGSGGSAGGSGGTAPSDVAASQGGAGGTAPAPRDAALIVDVASAAGPEAGSTPPLDNQPPPTMPPTLPGLVLWLDASKGVTAAGMKVSRWADQSPAKNDAVMDSAGSQPTLTPMASAGFPAIHFSGKKDPKNGGGDGGPYLRIKDNASMNWGTGDWLIEAVVAYDNPLDGTHNGAFGTFFGKSASKVEILFTGNWPWSETKEMAALHIGFGESGIGMETKRTNFNDLKLRVYSARRNKGTLEVRINGKVDSSHGNAATNLDMPGIDAALGSFTSGSSSRCLRGDMYLMMAVHGPTDDATLKTLESYLISHFNAAP